MFSRNRPELILTPTIKNEGDLFNVEHHSHDVLSLTEGDFSTYMKNLKINFR